MDYKKIMTVALMILLAVISITLAAPVAADPANHKHSIEQTEEKIASVMKLSGGAAATSATLSVLPGDMCTPLAEQLAEMAKYFLLILSALYLEKFLISLSGYVSFMFLIPLACLIVCIGIIIRKKHFYGTAFKILLIALSIFFIVPVSVKLSDMVYETQASKINETVNEYNELEIEGDSDSGLLNEISEITTGTIDKITSFMDKLLESLAVMIVTSCLIPLLVLIVLIWLIKTIFSTNLPVMDPSFYRSMMRKARQAE